EAELFHQKKRRGRDHAGIYGACLERARNRAYGPQLQENDILRVEVVLAQGVTRRNVGAGSDAGDANLLPSEILHPFDLRPRVHRKDQFVNVVANNLEVRATESGGN